jgi:outer membrane protein assembly factor BamE (lipoprotein component of BamABCDE complex)
MRWIAILSAFVLAACSMVGENSPQRETQESVNQKITKGKTTKAEVKTLFGEPSSTTSKERGVEEWRYKMSSPASTVKIPGFEKFFSSGTEKDKTLLVDFDRRGIVTNYSLDEDSK